MSSIIPANNSGSGGSASNETVPQFSNSISSFFPPNKSTESSESNERHPKPQFSDSISTYFPPNKSTESSESNERHPKPQFSDSISSYFPPNKSTESSEPSDTSTNESIHIHQSTSTRLLEFEDLHFGEVKHHLQLAGPVVGGGGDAAMDSVDWRTQLQPHFRQRILNNMNGITGRMKTNIQNNVRKTCGKCR
nr:uncharacterized protein LOC111988392 isoform X2 [Quercus suber]